MTRENLNKNFFGGLFSLGKKRKKKEKYMLFVGLQNELHLCYKGYFYKTYKTMIIY